MTRSAYVQVRCAVVALWSERHQRYAAKTGPETSNLTQNYGFAGSSFLGRALGAARRQVVVQAPAPAGPAPHLAPHPPGARRTGCDPVISLPL